MRDSVANTLTRKYPNKIAIPFAKSKKNTNFAIKDGEITPSRQKNKRVSLFCARLFVILHPN